ncbi:hypothetical protein [Lysobacter enzymogenes]|uniref:hypothetical protein n=1 Tax=Lysobacter enzymogenes TaxID=69 RepID=UPI001AF302E3|nr:hypothetical protein [Lysobacter enzymogenes]QQP99555.1 hypothetical protein JHW41_15680 [Lysobacter enzymogenes]
MKSVLLHRQFVNDLLGNGDAHFAKKIFGHVYAEAEGIANNKDDHRYHGIDNAWIRYASRGRTAYRIIYVVRSGRLIFYRCGQHSVEDSVVDPRLESDDLVELEVIEDEVENMTKPLSILSTNRQPYIYSALLGRRLIPNKSVYLVSPFIDPTILARGHRLGQTLDSIRGDGSEVIVITCADQVAQFGNLHKDLAARGIELVFLPKLHSKIYLFLTDTDRQHITAATPSLGIIGSSNLTAMGIPATPDAGNLETNYSVASSSIKDLENVVIEFYSRARDYRTTLVNTNNRRIRTR